MIELKHIEVGHFKSAFRGMRNPLESHEQSDSIFEMITDNHSGVYMDEYADIWRNEIVDDDDESLEKFQDWAYPNCIIEHGDSINKYALIGPKDLELAQKLILAGPDHRKFMRHITISMDITAPLYWWKEMDTYKIGTTANSYSTMHKLATTPITKECFSFDIFNSGWNEHHLLTNHINGQGVVLVKDITDATIKYLEELRLEYLQTKDKRYWRALIQLLPSSWNQTRTWSGNYEVLRNIYFARNFHKLMEWREFCIMIANLPWGEELICVSQNDIQPEKKYFLSLEK